MERQRGVYKQRGWGRTGEGSEDDDEDGEPMKRGGERHVKFEGSARAHLSDLGSGCERRPSEARLDLDLPPQSVVH